MASYREVLEALVAKLGPPGGGKGSGKLERTRYADGGERLEVRLHLPAGTAPGAVRVVAGARVLGEVRLADGRGELDLRSEDGADIPPLSEAEVVEVRSADGVLLEGVLEPD